MNVSRAIGASEPNGAVASSRSSAASSSGFPREPRADIDRMNARRSRLGRGEHRAVEARRQKRPAVSTEVRLLTMISVTKRIDFCYGHRLLDYDGICKHPHGHNAVAEIEVRTDALDTRNMVVDFSDIKRVVKGWIDRELDHKMILRHDDPLVKPLQSLGEPIFIVDSNPTVERIARLIYDMSREQGLPVVRVTVWETPTSWATYSAA